MLVHSQLFEVSQDFLLNQRKKRLVTGFVLLPLAVLMVFSFRDSILERITNSFDLIALLIIVVVVLRIVAKGFHQILSKNTGLVLNSEGISWVRNKDIHKQLKWSEINRVNILRSPDGNIYSIRLFPEAKRSVLVIGYDNIDRLLEFILASIRYHTIVKTNQLLVRRDHPWLPSMILLLVLLFFCLLRLWLGIAALKIAVILLRSSLALFFLVKQPTSQIHPRLAVLDLATGSFLLWKSITQALSLYSSL